VTELGPDDVLLGRGTGPSSNEGNVNFRNAVEAMKSDYVSTPSRKAKNKFVRKTVEAIKAKKGRFLSKLRKSEIKMLGMSAHKAVYEVVRDDVAFEKTKQAIRYVHYKKDANQGTAKAVARSSKSHKVPSPKKKTEAMSFVKPVPSQRRERSPSLDMAESTSSVDNSAKMPSQRTGGFTESTLAQILLAQNSSVTPRYMSLALPAQTHLHSALNQILQSEPPVLRSAPASSALLPLLRGSYPMVGVGGVMQAQHPQATLMGSSSMSNDAVLNMLLNEQLRRAGGSPPPMSHPIDPTPLIGGPLHHTQNLGIHMLS
jgi:hypothetical protein